MKFHALAVSAVLLFLTFTAGCGGPKAPPGFPKNLTAFEFKILYGGNPLENATIVFISDPPAAYFVGGRTGADGSVKLETSINNYFRQGAPPGTYKVGVSHSAVASSMPTEEEMAAMSDEQRKAVEDKIDAEIAAMPVLVPAHWLRSTTSPVTITVPAKGGSVTVEITDENTFVQ